MKAFNEIVVRQIYIHGSSSTNKFSFAMVMRTKWRYLMVDIIFIYFITKLHSSWCVCSKLIYRMTNKVIKNLINCVFGSKERLMPP